MGSNPTLSAILIVKSIGYIDFSARPNIGTNSKPTQMRASGPFPMSNDKFVQESYDKFIEEVDSFISTGEMILTEPARSHEWRVFREWRCRIEGVVEWVKTQYELSLRFESASRAYRARDSYSDDDVTLRIFDRDLGDSLTELSLIREHFQRYGAPPRRQRHDGSGESPSGQPKSADAKEKISLKWIYDHVPVSLLAKLVIVIMGIGFVIGVAVANSTSLDTEKFVAWIAGMLGW